LKLQSVFKSLALSAECECVDAIEIKAKIDNNFIRFFTLFIKTLFMFCCS